MSSNYTHVVRDVINSGINVLAQLVAKEPVGGTFSLSCNPDLTQQLGIGSLGDAVTYLLKLRHELLQRTLVYALASIDAI